MNPASAPPPFQLRLFGTPSIEGPDGVALTGRVVQRHRLALLALLALSPGARLSRDKLMALLWPESDSEKARNLLSVATYVLRGSLGDDTIATAGDELRLDTSALRTDVGAFAAAVERGDHAAAVALYTGPLLDGFFLGDAPDFEHWLAGERDRLAAAHRKAVEALAESATGAGNHAVAVELWKSLAAQDPFDSRVAARLIQSLDAAGNRAGALQHASLHQRMLRQEFGIAEPPEIATLVASLRAQPTVQASPAPVASEPAIARPVSLSAPASATMPAAPTSAPAAATPPVSHFGTQRRLLPWAAAFAALVLLAGAAWRIRPASTAADAERSIAVLPFADLSAARDSNLFADGVTEEITAGLSGVPGLTVISRTSAMHYRGAALPLRRIAEELGVGHILEGSVRRSGTRVRITAQLIDARTDRHLWADSFDEELRDVLSVQEQIARRVVQALELKLGDRAGTALVRLPTKDSVAYELYRRARYLWSTRTREGHERAADYYRQAIARDSSFADAYSGLADTYLTSIQVNVNALPAEETYRLALAAVERALALDDRSADAHATFGIAMHWQHDWPASERAFRRALQLNPNHVSAHNWYGLLLSGMGRPREAMAEIRRAVALDPFSTTPLGNYGWQCYLSRDYDCAMEQLRRTTELGGSFALGRGLQRLALVYAQKGMLEEAMRAVRKSVEISPERTDFLADLAYIHALRGERAQAMEALRRAERSPFEPFSVGRAWVALGEPDSAFAWLAQANWQWSHRADRRDPALDPVRSDPRFTALSERIDREMGLR